jgi:hypothetical protein
VKEVAGAEYAGLLDDLLKDVQQTKASLESRAGGVVTTSAALVTLLFGFTAVTRAAGRPQFPSFAARRLSIALVLIVAAAALAILVTAPFRYRSVGVNEMQRLTEQSLWAYEDRTEAARMVARARIGELRWARQMNTAKGLLLLLAIIAEVAGIGLLAATVIAILG